MSVSASLTGIQHLLCFLRESFIASVCYSVLDRKMFIPCVCYCVLGRHSSQVSISSSSMFSKCSCKGVRRLFLCLGKMSAILYYKRALRRMAFVFGKWYNNICLIKSFITNPVPYFPLQSCTYNISHPYPVAHRDSARSFSPKNM